MHVKDKSCEEFIELRNSNVVDVRSGCIAIITRDKTGNCITSSGPTIKYCPYCGNKIVSEYDDTNCYWDWWHE